MKSAIPTASHSLALLKHHSLPQVVLLPECSSGHPIPDTGFGGFLVLIFVRSLGICSHFQMVSMHVVNGYYVWIPRGHNGEEKVF